MQDEKMQKAVTFLLAIRNAGKHPNANGIVTFDASKVREDQIKAITEYCGYDTKQPHGVQLDNACRQAKAIHLPQHSAAKRKLSPTVQGYVKGTPNHQAKALDNLKARQKLSQSTLYDIEQKVRHAASDEEKTFFGKLAKVEEKRLETISQDIRDCR